MIAFMCVAPNGEIISNGVCPESQLEFQETPGCVLVEGDGVFGEHYYDWRIRRAVELPARPSQYHRFDYDTKAWVVRPDAVDLLREERDRRLAASDWVLLGDVPLSDDKRVAWKAYRQALRDMPKTVNWANIKWPVPPS